MKVHADRETCVGAALCAKYAPQVFGIDDEGKVVVIEEHPDEELGPAVRTAEGACPSFAIDVSESD